MPFVIHHYCSDLGPFAPSPVCPHARGGGETTGACWAANGEAVWPEVCSRIWWSPRWAQVLQMFFGVRATSQDSTRLMVVMQSFSRLTGSSSTMGMSAELQKVGLYQGPHHCQAGSVSHLTVDSTWEGWICS